VSGPEFHSQYQKENKKRKKRKMTLRSHLTLVRLIIIKKTNNNESWRGCGGKGTYIYC
jgi:hypothetical protein